MFAADVALGEREFTITWDDRSVAAFPFIWLRDNDPDDLHPDTHERVFDLTQVPVDISPDSFSVDRSAVVVTWPGKARPSVYPLEWLQRHQPGRPRHDPSRVEQILWDRAALASIPRLPLSRCATEAAALREALLILKRLGILLIDGLDDSPHASQSFGDLIGFRRRTNFGDMFEVFNMVQPNNLAYTSLQLPLHTDLPNQEIIPGYQLLHCYRNTTDGGESLFADGFRVCEELKNAAPQDYELLRRVAVPWRFHDAANDIRRHRPIITERADGKLDYLVFNAHIADIPDMAAGQLYDYYKAYQGLMQRLRDPQYALRHALAPGEMVIFDNTRVLHGRTAFDPQSGERHLYGYYIERNEVDSRIRVLSREETTCR